MTEEMDAEDVRKILRGEHVPPKPAKRATMPDVLTDRLAFTIPGVPIGKPRMTRRDKWKQRPCVIRYRAWADAARLAAGQLPDANLIQRLDWTAYFAPPSSWSKSKRASVIGTLHRSRPDRDNVDKAILDALFKSDSAIAFGTLRKEWGEPERLEVVITRV